MLAHAPEHGTLLRVREAAFTSLEEPKVFWTFEGCSRFQAGLLEVCAPRAVHQVETYWSLVSFARRLPTQTFGPCPIFGQLSGGKDAARMQDAVCQLRAFSAATMVMRMLGAHAARHSGF